MAVKKAKKVAKKATSKDTSAKKVKSAKATTTKAPATKTAKTAKVAKATKKVATKVAKKATAKVATTTAKAAAPKSTEKKAVVKRKPNPSFMKPLVPSAELAAIVGSAPLPRTEVVKKMWAYIKKNGLQDSKNKRNINADEKLKAVFGGQKTVSMFEMSKLVSQHLK